MKKIILTQEEYLDEIRKHSRPLVAQVKKKYKRRDSKAEVRKLKNNIDG